MLGIDTCKLDLQGNHILYRSSCNLVSVLTLLQLGFNITFVGYCVKIYLDNIFYCFGFVLNGFIVLDIINISINNDVSIYIVENSVMHVWNYS